MSSNPPPAQPIVPLSPLPHISLIPDSLAFRNLQQNVAKFTLDSVPEPTAGGSPHIKSQEEHERLMRMTVYGEAQLARLGPRIDLQTLRTTLYGRFYRTLIYWRLFRFIHLPPEIIGNIFRMVVWSTPNTAVGVKQRLHLTWVCSAWRRLMIEDSTLWNAIWFHEAPPYERPWEWFRRAGTAPLDIRINEYFVRGEEHPKFTAERMSEMLDKVFTKLPQIRMLVITVDNWPPALTVLQKLQAAGNTGIPINIERLEIHRSSLPYVWIGPGFDTNGHRDPAVLFGGRTQHLRHLCLSGLHIDFNDTPFSNLTTLDLRHIAMEYSPTLLRFREILATCSRLDKLTLDGCGPQPESKYVERPAIELRNLRTLSIGAFNLSYACLIIHQIRAPRLRDLNLMNLTGGDYMPLIALLTRRFMQVRILTLYNTELVMNAVGKRTFVRWLESMPEIAYMRLARMNQEVLNTFAENPNNYRRRVDNGATTPTVMPACLCPRLQFLELQGLSTEIITEFCRLRREIGVPITKMYLITPWAHRLTHEELKLLQQEASVLQAPVGHNTAEEDTLLSGGWVIE